MAKVDTVTVISIQLLLDVDSSAISGALWIRSVLSKVLRMNINADLLPAH